MTTLPVKQDAPVLSADAPPVDMFDFANIVSTVINAVLLHRIVVVVTTALVIAAAALYHYAWPPVYTAEAVIMVERPEDPERDAFYKEWNLFRKQEPRTELELMKSGTVLRRLIEKEQLRYKDVYHPLMSQLSYFWNESFLGKSYKAIKRFFLGPSAADLLSEEEKELGKTIQDLRAGLYVETAGDVLIGEVRTRGPSPRISQITNTWMDTYLEWRREVLEEEARRSLDALSQQIDKVHEQILEMSRERVDFLTANGLVFDFTKETQQVEKMVNLDSEISATETRIDVIRAHLDELNKQLLDEPERKIVSAVSELNSVRDAAMVKKLELETVLIRDMARFRSDAPEIRDLQTQIAELDALINANPDTREQSTTTALNQTWLELSRQKSNLEAELSGLVAGVAAMREQREEMYEALTRAPELASRLRDIDRDLSVAQQVYKVLLTKRAQADVSILSTEQAMPTMKVVDYAAPPVSQTWPKAKYLYPIALVLGVILGVVAALIKSFLGQKVTLAFLEQQGDTGGAAAVVRLRTRNPYRPLHGLATASPRLSRLELDISES